MHISPLVHRAAVLIKSAAHVQRPDHPAGGLPLHRVPPVPAIHVPGVLHQPVDGVQHCHHGTRVRALLGIRKFNSDYLRDIDKYPKYRSRNLMDFDVGMIA